MIELTKASEEELLQERKDAGLPHSKLWIFVGWMNDDNESFAQRFAT